MQKFSYVLSYRLLFVPAVNGLRSFVPISNSIVLIAHNDRRSRHVEELMLCLDLAFGTPPSGIDKPTNKSKGQAEIAATGQIWEIMGELPVRRLKQEVDQER